MDYFHYPYFRILWLEHSDAAESILHNLVDALVSELRGLELLPPQEQVLQWMGADLYFEAELEEADWFIEIVADICKGIAEEVEFDMAIEAAWEARQDFYRMVGY